MPYVKISPLTRLEGHLGVTVRVIDGYVKEAWSHGEMWRGIEKILLKRDPRDAPVITQRICGVCHFIHRHTSLRCIESSFGFRFPAPQAYDALNSVNSNNTLDDGEQPGYYNGSTWSESGTYSYWICPNRTFAHGDGTNPPSGDKLPAGAQLARNIVHALTFIYSHAAHTFVLAGPDYKEKMDEYVHKYGEQLRSIFGSDCLSDGEIYGGESFFLNFYKEAVIAQRVLHEMLGVLGGKVPHQASAVPGGFSAPITWGTLGKIVSLTQKYIPHKGDPNSSTRWVFLDLNLSKGEVNVGNVPKNTSTPVDLPTGGTYIVRGTIRVAYTINNTNYVATDDGFRNISGPYVSGSVDYAGGTDALTLTFSEDATNVKVGYIYGLSNDNDFTGKLDYKKNLTTANDWISKRVSVFTLALIYACKEVGANTWGKGSGNFVCAPTFDVVDPTNGGIIGDAYFRGGVRLGAYGGSPTNPGSQGTLKRLNPCAKSIDELGTDDVMIIEDVTSARYNEDSGLSPESEFDPSKGWPGETVTEYKLFGYNKYTWYKAPRVVDKGKNVYVVESGPLARLVVNDVDPYLNLTGDLTSIGLLDLSTQADPNHYLRTYYGGGKYQSSTANRLIGRLQDTLLLIDMLIGSDYSGENKDTGYLKEIYNNKCWLTRLKTVLDNNSGKIPGNLMHGNPTGKTWEDWKTYDGEGVGYWDAPRGITVHWCKVENGRLTQYQVIAGTTWNGNGRDVLGQPGPFEWSLMNFSGLTEVDMTRVAARTFEAEVTLEQNKPMVRNSVRVKYTINGKEYYAFDVPESETEGHLEGPYIDSYNSKVYYYYQENSNYKGKVRVTFTGLGLNIVQNLQPKVLYGTAGDDPVPTPNFVAGPNANRPDPINVLRTIRSYDPCLACSMHMIHKGEKYEFVIVPVGFEP